MLVTTNMSIITGEGGPCQGYVIKLTYCSVQLFIVCKTVAKRKQKTVKSLQDFLTIVRQLLDDFNS